MGVRLIVGFAISFAALMVAPAVLPHPHRWALLVRPGDAVDLLTPFVLISGYYLLYRSADDWASEPPSGTATALLLFGSILFIEGHGMHLAANSIGHYVPANPIVPAYVLIRFYDEGLSHYLWHIGIQVLAVVLLWRHYQPVKKGVDLWQIHTRQRLGLGVAALLYGVTVALATIEGQTVPVVLPSSAILGSLFALSWWRQKQLPGGPTFAFLGMGYVIATLAVAGWGVYWHGFPEFSTLGWIGGTGGR